MEKAYIYFKNGVLLEGFRFGSCGTSVGEVVFNTSITGYQEIITDPSYAGQLITFTMPEIGNVGINDDDFESSGAFARGIIVRNYNDNYSNYRANSSLDSLLKKYNIIGIYGIDTRFITKMIRDNGAMKAVISTEFKDINKLKEILNNALDIENEDLISEVTTKNSYMHKNGLWDFDLNSYKKGLMSDKKVVVIDFGVKKNILNNLVEAGLEVEVISSKFEAKDLIDRFKNKQIGGIFLSNGPGDPKYLKKEIKEIKKLIDANIPMFGICLGHQLLSNAFGYETYKLPYGHHGGNHPVKNRDGIVEITAQNHNYNVPDTIAKVANVTHINLFDNTIEGVEYKNKPIFSTQHHPEASPGPVESKYVFNKFANMVKSN